MLGGRPWTEHAWVRALRGGRGRPFGFLLLALFLGLLLGPELRAVTTARLAAFDAYQVLAPRVRTSAPVVIVEIDEQSLARYGQWPWPRTLLARLVTTISAADPAAIGIDIVMPEPDRLSPPGLSALVPGIDRDLAERLSRLKGNDAVLADALRGVPVALGVAGLDRAEPEAPASPGRSAPARLRGGDPGPLVRRFEAALRSVEELDRAAPGHGLLNADREAGVVRRMPLVAAVRETLLPTLGIEMLRLASGEPTFSVQVEHGGVAAVGVGDLRVPTQPDGTAWLHFSPHDPARFVSAAQVLAGTVPAERLSRKLVLLGVTAVGLSDFAATPLAERMPGVEIHAQLLEGIFDRALLSRPRWLSWAEAGLLATGGLLLILAVPALSARRSASLLLVMVGVALALGLLLFQRAGILFDAASPAIGFGILYTAMLGVTLTEADSQRRALRHQLALERDAAARLAGELEAARRIQMGTLPRAAQVFPGEERFDLYAFLEPARVVGGDLYDFFRLDPDRVFFLIGDVSGKGLPGSLFMAVSKSLYKSTALRRPDEVATMMREANAEISRDNPECLFVTVFAGILDARSGRIEYCNAGHENPFVLPRDGRPLSQLTQGDGPPLCVVDDFPYSPATYPMRPGDTLCLVTDGVTEARNGAGELYGRTRLEALLGGLEATAATDDVGEAIRSDVRRFVADAEPADDLTILVLRWNGPAGSSG